jgi:hypothetical protein
MTSQQRQSLIKMMYAIIAIPWADQSMRERATSLLVKLSGV